MTGAPLLPPSRGRAAEAGSRGSISPSVSKYLPTEGFIYLYEVIGLLLVVSGFFYVIFGQIGRVGLAILGIRWILVMVVDQKTFLNE